MLDVRDLLDNVDDGRRPNLVGSFVPVGRVLDTCRGRGNVGKKTFWNIPAGVVHQAVV
jgi:hypothetical protein